MNTRPRTLVLLIGAILATSASYAERGNGFQAGSSRIIPTLGVTLSYDDNVTAASDNEIDSFVTVISPGIKLENGDEARNFSFSYQADIGRYNDSSTDNYDNHSLNAGAIFSPSSRTRLALGAAYQRKTESRGTGARQGQFIDLQGRDPDEYGATSFNGAFDYGGEGSQAGLGVDIGTSDRQYKNNGDYTQFRDFSENFYGGYFRYRVASKTSAKLSVRQTEVQFDNLRRIGRSDVSFDSTERSLFLGLEFDATAKVTGSINAGRIEKDFDDVRLDDFSGFGWKAGVQFRPRTYSTIDVTTSRMTDEADDVLLNAALGQVNSFIIRRDITVAWTHGWTDRFQTGVDLVSGTDEYRSALDESTTRRDDDFSGFGVSADYVFRPWLSVGASFKRYSRDSTSRVFEYDKNLFLLSFEATL